MPRLVNLTVRLRHQLRAPTTPPVGSAIVQMLQSARRAGYAAFFDLLVGLSLRVAGVVASNGMGGGGRVSKVMEGEHASL